MDETRPHIDSHSGPEGRQLTLVGCWSAAALAASGRLAACVAAARWHCAAGAGSGALGPALARADGPHRRAGAVECLGPAMASARCRACRRSVPCSTGWPGIRWRRRRPQSLTPLAALSASGRGGLPGGRPRPRPACADRTVAARPRAPAARARAWGPGAMSPASCTASAPRPCRSPRWSVS